MASPRLRSRLHRSAKPTEINREATVSRYYHDYVDCGKPAWAYIARHPGKSLGALIALLRLPCLYVASTPAGAEGTDIRALMWPDAKTPPSPRSLLRRVTGFATAAISVPHEPGQYSLGASKQTLRRKVRRAQQLGVTWAEVSDPQERQELVKLTEESERTHPDERHRIANPDNSGLLKYRLWLAAYSAEGAPLLLSVSPFDGELAVVGYFRTIGTGEKESAARYLMTKVLVEHLAGRGVRYLLDGGSLALPNGIRHFQRMVGFRIVRIRYVRSGQAGSLRVSGH